MTFFIRRADKWLTILKAGHRFTRWHVVWNLKSLLTMCVTQWYSYISTMYLERVKKSRQQYHLSSFIQLILHNIRCLHNKACRSTSDFEKLLAHNQIHGLGQNGVWQSTITGKPTDDSRGGHSHIKVLPMLVNQPSNLTHIGVTGGS